MEKAEELEEQAKAFEAIDWALEGPMLHEAAMAHFANAEQELQFLLRDLTANQIKFIATRLMTASTNEACRFCGIDKSVVWRWREEHGLDLDRILNLSRSHVIYVAREWLSRLVLKAIRVLEEELDKPMSKRRMDAALAVLDRAGLVPGSTMNIKSQQQALVVTYEPYESDAGEAQAASPRPAAG